VKADLPYYAVIFTSIRTPADESGYAAMTEAMLELARQQPGFLGVEHARSSVGITVSYWDSLQSIAAWKSHSDHRIAQKKGKNTWYESYRIRICRVEREYAFDGKDEIGLQ
jgi:heme-degrading monooxygenase HmoA